MALANYSDLATSIASWSSRNDVSAIVPDLVRLAESDFNRELRVADMLVNNSAFMISGEYTNFPSGFLEVRDWYLNVSPRYELCFMPDEEITNFYSASGPPKYYNLSGNQFRVGPIPDGTYSTTLRYYQSIPGLQANTTNWLMTAHPNLYLYGCLAQAAMYSHDDDQMQKWGNAYGMEMKSVKDSYAKRRFGGSGMTVRADRAV